MLTDKFNFKKQGLLQSSTPLDCTNATQVLNFEIGGLQPTATQRKILFLIDDLIFKFVDGVLTKVDCDLNFENVLKFGNSSAELLALDNITAFVGKEIFPVIALESEADVAPEISIALKIKNFSDILSKSEFSPVYDFGEDCKFISADCEKNISGGATVTLKVRLRNKNLWSDWLEIADAQNLFCDACQLRADIYVTSTSGDSGAQITAANIYYTKAKNFCATAESVIYFKPEDFDLDLATCYILIKHSELQDNDLKCFVNFQDAIEEKNFVAGVGTGAEQIFELDDGVVFDTLKVKIAGVPTFDFSFDALTKNLKITAPIDKEISVSYKCNLQPETWLECDKQFTALDENFDKVCWTSRFVCRLDTPKNSKVAKIKIVSEVQSGEDNFSFTATGKQEIFVPAHKVNADSISTTADYFFDAENNLLKLQGAADSNFDVSYTWQGVPIEIYKIAAGFSL